MGTHRGRVVLNAAPAEPRPACWLLKELMASGPTDSIARRTEEERSRTGRITVPFTRNEHS
eukprot:7322630-Prymnesium_polylepis.1